MSANTRRLRVARSRIRAAITLLREARGLDSMDMETWELVRLDAICLESVAATVTLHIAATNKHLEAGSPRVHASRLRRLTPVARK